MGLAVAVGSGRVPAAARDVAETLAAAHTLMIALGIDFGTTNTVAALGGGERCRLVDLGDGQKVIPSVVRYMPDGGVVVGTAALSARPYDPENTIYSVKRILGRPWHSREVLEYRNQYPFVLEEDEGAPWIQTRAGRLSPVDVAGEVFRVVTAASEVARAKVDSVTITVPVAAREDQRQATIAAASRASSFSMKLIDEPSASASAYLHGQAGPVTVAVYDLGGGTFDLAILRWQGSETTVLANGGDTYLGGDDVTYRCAHWVADRILESDHWDLRANRDAMAALMLVCENAKIELSRVTEVELDLEAVDPNLAGRKHVLQRSTLEELSDDLVHRTFILCDEVIAKSGIAARSIDMTILAGGGSYMPCIRQGVERYFGERPRMDVAPDQVVAIGAAWAAHLDV